MLKQFRSLFGRKPTAATDPKELFAGEVEEFLRSLANVSDVKRAPDAFAFDVIVSGGARRAYLDNAFAESREMSPEQRREKIAFFFATIVEEKQTESWEAARATFVPVLRGATYGMELWTKNPGVAFVRKPFLPFVDVVVAIDRPTSMSFVSKALVSQWKVEDRDVFDAAEARMPVLANPRVDLYDKTHGPLWIVATEDTYESSRLLVPGWLASFRGKVDGNPLAIIPQRAMLMVGGDGRREMVERLIDAAEREFGASNRRLSPALYSVDAAGSVVPYARAEGDDLANKVKIAHEKLALYEYRQQTEALDKHHESSGVDVFVGNYKVFENEGSLRSLCVWTQGVRSYLPKTDRVVLVPGDKAGSEPKATVEVSFDAIRGRLQQVPDLHPPRFETTGAFPSESELRLLAGKGPPT
jgi:hypothetical protein